MGEFKREIVDLKDGAKATLFFLSKDDIDSVPADVFEQMREIYNSVIEEGQTYPYYDKAENFEQFRDVWLMRHFTVLVAGEHDSPSTAKEVLGTYYVKPNYAGRCSHVSNAGFLVSSRARGQGLGKILGQSYVHWAPKLGYTYSVFNLVFATNVASWRAWETLGFERIGCVPGAARLKGYDKPIDAYIYGKSLV